MLGGRKVTFTMTRSQFDNADLGEMLLVVDAAYHAGFERVEVWAEQQIALLAELIELRQARELRVAYG